jgi:archaellum component FlaC
MSTTQNLSNLKIHKLSQAQYDREKAKGQLDSTAIYLTPDNSEEAISELANRISEQDETLTNIGYTANYAVNQVNNLDGYITGLTSTVSDLSESIDTVSGQANSAEGVAQGVRADLEELKNIILPSNYVSREELTANYVTVSDLVNTVDSKIASTFVYKDGVLTIYLP